MMTAAITTLSQPFVVIAVRMVKHQLGEGKSWLYAYLRLLTNEGLPYLYTALRYDRATVETGTSTSR